MSIIYQAIPLALLQRLLIAPLHTDLTELPWSCVHLLQLLSLDPVIRFVLHNKKANTLIKPQFCYQGQADLLKVIYLLWACVCNQ